MPKKEDLGGPNNVLHTRTKNIEMCLKKEYINKLMFTHLKAT